MSPLATSAPKLDRHREVGVVESSAAIDVLLKLRRSTSTLSLEAFLAGERRFVDREGLAARHGASSTDIEAVRTWATQQGLTVSRVHAPSRSMFVRGSAELMTKAFAIELSTYRHADTDVEFRGHTNPVSLAPALQDIVTGVFGLDSLPIVQPHSRLHPEALTATQSDSDASSASSLKERWPTTFFPQEVARLYDFPTTSLGAGQRVAILEFGGAFDTEKLESYWRLIGLDTSPTVNAHTVLGAKQDPQGAAVGETYLDIEVVGAMAPEAVIDVYFAPFSSAGYLAAIDAAIHNHDYAAISISYGMTEDAPDFWSSFHQEIDKAFHDAAMLGIPVFASAGDNGSGNARRLLDGEVVTPVSSEAHASYSAASPYATACGGTQLYATDDRILNEVVWNEQVEHQDDSNPYYSGGATGGGVSDHYDVPSYQSSAGLAPKSANPDGKTGRGLPDVAGNAGSTTGYLVTQPPGAQVPVGPVGGTSAVAPMWAALMARVRGSLASTPDPFFFNDFLYDVADSDAFRAVVQGADYSSATPTFVVPTFTPTGNNRSATVEGYTAADGYDLCTGLGSPHGANLLAQLEAWLRDRS
ncbi:MAG: S53 family serine peptidase [Acidobacteriota bacterium]